MAICHIRRVGRRAHDPDDGRARGGARPPTTGTDRNGLRLGHPERRASATGQCLHGSRRSHLRDHGVPAYSVVRRHPFPHASGGGPSDGGSGPPRSPPSSVLPRVQRGRSRPAGPGRVGDRARAGWGDDHVDTELHGFGRRLRSALLLFGAPGSARIGDPRRQRALHVWDRGLRAPLFASARGGGGPAVRPRVGASERHRQAEGGGGRNAGLRAVVGPVQGSSNSSATRSGSITTTSKRSTAFFRSRRLWRSIGPTSAWRGRPDRASPQGNSWRSTRPSACSSEGRWSSRARPSGWSS